MTEPQGMAAEIGGELLVQLGAELHDAGWPAKLLKPDSGTRTAKRTNPDAYQLRVTNPAHERLSDDIQCHETPTGWVYCWSTGNEIGPVENKAAVAKRIMDVLRTVAE